jgi:hypothetical protein
MKNMTKKMKNFFTPYTIGTILFALFTLIYWFDYNISPDLKLSTFVVLGLFALPVKVMFDKYYGNASFSENISYFILANASSIILFTAIRIKKQGVSVSNLFNVTSLFILLSIWFVQLNYEFTFVTSMLIKGLIVGLFGTVLIILNSEKHQPLMVEEEDEFEEGFEKEKKTESPVIREGLQ